MGNTCEEYLQIKILYKKKKIITENFANNNNIDIMKKDKGKGVIIIDRNIPRNA